ncbi:hypothetical protein [Neobacillus jeddahensis]|uniref:hypothetical protein n=1 Tax=Neobacillus jeddahensis TaxID=1461580 RepID=UPI0005A7A03E|nr:hypothetical protein [Neobacillus jeddahensis]
MFAINVNDEHWMLDYYRDRTARVLTFTTEKQALKEVNYIKKSHPDLKLTVLEVEEVSFFDPENSLSGQRIEVKGGNSDMANTKGKMVANLGDTVVTVEGPTEQFGSLGLQINAIKGLIEMLNFKSVEEDDPEASQKAYLVLLDTIGAMLKTESPAFDNDNTRNIEAVHQFLEWVLKAKIHEQTGYSELLDKDEEDLDWT